MELSAGAVKEPIICHICDFQPEYGGAFVEALVHLNRYCRHNFNVGILCAFPVSASNRNWLKRLDEEGVRYALIPRQRNIMRHVRVLLKNYDPLILHTHFFLFDLSAVLMKLLIYRNCKIVWHYHNPTEFTSKQRIKDAFKVRICFNRFGDRGVAVGDGVYESMRATGFMPRKTVLIHNAVNISRFLKKCEVTLEARRELQISGDAIAFLLLGWDPVRKGVDIFLRAAEEMCRRNYKNCRFLVVGRAETRRFVSQLLCNSDLSHDVFQVIDPVEDITLLLKCVDVLVSASRSEGLSYSVLEAMAAEKLILSSDIASVRETYGKSNGVWLFPNEDWKALSDLMIRFVGSLPAERRSLAHANSQYVLENHSLDRWAQRIVQLYKELLSPCRTLPSLTA
jgi:glycosyltransferase involved in cell wall biosynthesis